MVKQPEDGVKTRLGSCRELIASVGSGQLAIGVPAGVADRRQDDNQPSIESGETGNRNYSDQRRPHTEHPPIMRHHAGTHHAGLNRRATHVDDHRKGDCRIGWHPSWPSRERNSQAVLLEIR